MKNIQSNSPSNFFNFFQGSCPGLTHDQKFGFSYAVDKHETRNVDPVGEPQSRSVIMISEPLSMRLTSLDESHVTQIPENPHTDDGTVIQDPNHNLEIERDSSDEKDSQFVSEEIQT